MQVIPVNAPNSSASPSTATPAPSARERAISAYMTTSAPVEPPKASTQAQIRDLPVQDPNKVDLQELAQLSQSNTIEDSQSAKEENPAEAPPKAPSPKEDPALSSQYAALARREKALRARAVQQEQSLQAREAALKAREASLQAPSQSFDPSKYVSLEDLGKDPFAHLAKANLTYDSLVEQAMNAPKPEDLRLQQMQANYDAKIKALEDKLEGTNKSIKEQETNAYQGAINQIRADVRNLVNKDPAFETIKVTGQHEEVVKLIESVYKDGMGDDYPKGTVLDPSDAAKMVEDEIAENLYQWSSKAQKVKSRFASSQQVAPAKDAQKQVASQPSSSAQMKTLTNQMTSSRQISARDRAILAAQGKLNK